MTEKTNPEVEALKESAERVAEFQDLARFSYALNQMGKQLAEKLNYNLDALAFGMVTAACFIADEIEDREAIADAISMHWPDTAEAIAQALTPPQPPPEVPALFEELETAGRRRSIEIGRRLHELGGTMLMLQAVYRIQSRHGHDAGSRLVHRWRGIGDWADGLDD